MDLSDWKIISSYTRAEAVEDGVQVRILQEASREAGIVFPVFMTRGVFNKYVRVPDGMPHQSESGRLWDILFMFRLAAMNTPGSDLLFKFVCQLPDAGNWTRYEKMCEGNRLLREITLRAVIGPIDLGDLQPAITILFPNKD
jgi:hypothetical protein